jgi:TonB family protein
MFTVLADGTITKVSVVESSGFTLLDSAAEEILTELEKVRPFPKELAASKFEITLPISYTIR